MTIPYYFHQQLVLRCPSYPLQTTTEHHSLECYLQDERFQEALYLASPVLHAELVKFKEGRITDARSTEKLYRSVTKYYLRMSSRCTPFGLFSGCSLAKWGDHTRIQVDEGIQQRHTRFDMHYLCALAQMLAELPFIAQYLRYFPNNSLYSLSSELRYIEYKYINGKRNHTITSVVNSPYLLQVLEKASTGACIAELAAALINEEIDEAEATEFINELIREQILVNELEPSITGVEFLHQMIATLNSIKTPDNILLTQIIEQLEELNQLLVNIDNNGLNLHAAYQQIMEKLKAVSVELDESKLFQTDTFFPSTSNTVTTSLQQQLLEGLNLLARIPLPAPRSNMQLFARRFYERYEDKEVPLLEVLDVETGIGYMEKQCGDIIPLVQDLYLPPKEVDNTTTFTARDQLLLKKLDAVFSSGAEAMQLYEEDVPKEENAWAKMPPSFSVMFRLLDEEKIYLESGGGSSAANILGRFAHSSEEIHRLVSEIATEEQAKNPDVIFAEIVHLPESRVGNILLHPAFRAYEIPFLAKPSVITDFQLPLQDLVVSVKDNKVILRSKRLNKQIIPRLSSAHNYSNNALPVYQFLCELQTQELRSGLGFYWGLLESVYVRLPRVQYKNIIISPAQWNFTKAEVSELLTTEKEAVGNALQRFRSQWKLPKLVVLSDGDNELLINFDDPVMVNIWLDSIRNRARFSIKEFLHNPARGIAVNHKGKVYANQFIAILQRHQPAYTAIMSSTKWTDKKSMQRSFPPGSEWVYYKLYCGLKSADRILTEAIHPLLKELNEKGLTDKFFFIRYLDPSFHLRVRVRLQQLEFLGDVLLLFRKHLSTLEAEGLIWKMQLDTYNREIERYGSNCIELAESLFSNDSHAVVNMLLQTDGFEREQIRWIWAVRAIDQLFKDFGFSLEQKFYMAKILKTAFHVEFKADKIILDQLTAKYRQYRKQIESVLTYDQTSDMQPLIDILDHKSVSNEPIVLGLQEIFTADIMQPALFDLMGSLVHMLVNRIVTSDPRTHELVLYDILFSYYRSLTEKEKQSSISSTKKIKAVSHV